jgi:hypothetical protein
MFVMNYGTLKRFGVLHPWVAIFVADFHGFYKEDELVLV